MTAMLGERLPVAVIGVGGFGARIVEAIRQSELVKLAGVADKDPAAAEQAQRDAGAPAYTDNRSLLAETRPQAVFLATPPAATPDLVAACAERGIHVWKELPLARDLAEGVAMVRRMDEAGLKFAVGTQRRFAPGYRRARELCPELGDVFLGRAHYLFNWGPDLRWRGDRNAAGGGALIELGYHPIDLLVWMLGLPEEVYGVSAISAGDPRRSAEPARPPYDTDDTAAGLLRYRNGLMAAVVTTRCSGPVSEELSLHGRGGSLTATAETCLLRDPDGNVLEHVQDQSPPVEPFRRQVDAFARAVRTGAERYECSGWENLLDLAVIEGLYLSDRTSQPENLPDLLQPHGITPDECLQCRPINEPAPGPIEAPESPPNEV